MGYKRNEKMNTLTREQAIDVILTNELFREMDLNTKAAEYYIKHLMEGYDIMDIDRCAWLNTLFGYDIGFENGLKIDSWMWNSKGDNVEIETLELGIEDKELVEECVGELGMELEFDKWAEVEPMCYEYY